MIATTPVASFPRITLPGVDPAERELAHSLAKAGRATDATIRRNREGMVKAMLAIGYKPYFGHCFVKPKPTKHVRHMARVAARSTKVATA